MNLKDLEKANEIVNEIKRLESFISYSERRWTGRLIQNAKGFVFRANAHGGLEPREVHLKTDLKNKILEVLREEVKILDQKLSKL